jgi:AraC family transcriptional regulator
MKTSTAADYHERILRTLAHIQAHLDDALDLDGLARVACFSPYHFHRVFRGLVGEPVQEHVRRLRLERAAQRLKLQDEAVTSVALNAGYESHEAFTRALVGATWGKLAAWAGPRGLFGPATRFIGVSYDDPQITPPEKLRYEAAITVSRPVQPEGEFGVMELAGGEYATLMHKGPYETLGRAYQMLLGAWLPQSGRELRDAPCFEAYLNSPQNTRPEELLTVIHAPV